MGQEFGSHLAWKFWLGVSHEVQWNISWGCSHLKSWMGLEDPLPMVYSHGWQGGAGYWWRPESSSVSLSTELLMSLHEMTAGLPQNVQSKRQSRVTSPLQLPLEIAHCNLHHTLFSHGLALIHGRRRLYKDMNTKQQESLGVILEATYGIQSHKNASYLISHWLQNKIILTFNVQIIMA